MMIREPLPTEEYDAERVAQPSPHHVRQRFMRNVDPELTRGDDDEPAHHNVQRDGQLSQPTDEQALEYDSQDGERPDSDHQGQSPHPPQREKKKRCVRACDEQVDRTVIEDPEHLLGQRRAECVVQRGR